MISFAVNVTMLWEDKSLALYAHEICMSLRMGSNP